MKLFLSMLTVWMGIVHAQALVINEILSNPPGTDNGREWIELYNDGSEAVTLSELSVSTTETGAATSLILISGEVSLSPGGYAVIGTIVSGQTKFLEDYPTYTGTLFRTSGSFTLTNAVASLYIRSGSSVVASVPSYTARGEGESLSFISGSYAAGTPTPGVQNQAISSGGGGGGGNDTTSATTSLQTENQTTIVQMTPPSPDIVMYIPSEKLVVAGADSEFSVTSATRSGKEIQNIKYTWAFGDGGNGTGSSTMYRYAYTGRYIAVVEGLSSTVGGTGRMVVRVVAPDVKISGSGTGKYGSYIDITNPNAYDLDLSQWRLHINDVGFPFPKNTLIPSLSTTRFSGLAMGFASTTIGTSTPIRILFPNQEEVSRFALAEPEVVTVVATGTVLGVSTNTVTKPVAAKATLKSTITRGAGVSKVGTTTIATSSVKVTTTRDTRIVSWMKTLFGR